VSALRVGMNLVWMGERAGGIGRYALELTGALAQEPDLELHVFASRDAPAELLQAPWLERVRLTVLPVRLGGPPLHLAMQGAALPPLALARRLDVLHSPAAVGPVRVPRVGCVVTLHDLIPMREGEAWETGRAARSTSALQLRCARWADRVLAVSEAARDDLIATGGLDPRKVEAVPSGVRPPVPGTPATPEAQLRAALDLGDGPVVLSVAQKRPYKNLPVLVRAVAALPDDRVRLVLPGAPTPHEAELRALAAELGIAHRVRFPDYVSEADLEGLYALAACFVLPSRIEGFGLPVLEAMARGVPVACSDLTALPEVAGDAAELFDPADQAAADAAVARLLADREWAAELVRRGHERVARFTWQATAAGTIAAYRRARRGNPAERRP
jgi:glycosyltransferase involved in cell wall biosynthesis